MKGDFSRIGFDPDSPYTGVRHQQGRVLLDRDWNDAQEIEARWRAQVGGDVFGSRVLAVPADSSTAFEVTSAVADATGIHIKLAAGHAWAAGLAVSLATDVTVDASYLTPPLAPTVDPKTVGAGVRDAVVLEVFEDTLSGFQDGSLLEPALGGPDTTERVRSFTSLKLLRLGDNEDCSAVAALVDDPSTHGKLSVSPSAAIVISGDCPLEAGGGYTGLEHYLYRIEVAHASSTGAVRFKWSRFNGGLVGRGSFAPGALPNTGTVAIIANAPAIDTCGLPTFWLEALAFDAAVGVWSVVFSANASHAVDGLLALTSISGAWPAGGTAFFRLWDGIAAVQDFAAATPTPLVDGIELRFDAPLADGSNYRPGDYWAFPVRATGAAFDPPIWPANALAQGVTYRRVALGVISWQADGTASFDRGQISDCRHIFRPLTQQKICCSYIVGDGKTSFGDFNSIELALRHLPASGGEICLLPGLHTTNTVIANRANVTIRGCGARTRVLPREETLGQPIFTVLDSTRVEIEHIDLVALGGTAIWIEGTKPGACDDIVITQHRILACTHAVFVRNASKVTIAHNRIRMIDKQGGLAAIDVGGEDILIERNDIALVPAERTPPITPNDPEDPLDPNDPCARLHRIYGQPRILSAYLNAFWLIPVLLPGLLTLLKPYAALGGIQVRGGSERVHILENQIIGGAGNGITLGAVLAFTPTPAPVTPSFDFGEGRLIGRVIGPDGKPMAGVQITLTRKSDGATQTYTSDANGRFVTAMGSGTYAVSEGLAGYEIDKIDVQTKEGAPITQLAVVMKDSVAPPEPDTGFLYEIAIERNRVQAMGLNGIGVPMPLALATGSKLMLSTAQARARALLGSPVIGLAIRDNRLVANLRNPFDAAMRAAALTRGFGGISLGLVDDAAITGNRIEGHGRSGADPVCGVFVQYGESVEIARNVVLDNGLAPSSAQVAISDGQRGGVVLGLVANFGLFAVLNRGVDASAAASAARVLANHVEQPVGCALIVRAFGPVMVNDNVLASERTSVGGLDALAGTVLIANLAGVQTAGLPVQTQAAAGVREADTEERQPVGALTRARLQIFETAFTRIAPLLPTGATLFNDNQVRAGPAHTAPVTQLVIGYDDIGFASNQCHTDQTANVYANTFIIGATLRATGNRFCERAASTNLSLLTISTRANNTTLNQGDHCIVAQDTDPAPPFTVQIGNQVMLQSKLCTSLNMVVALLFKPIAATISNP